MSKEEFRDRLRKVQSADLYQVAEYLFDRQGEEINIDTFYDELGVDNELVISFVKRLRYRYKFDIESINKQGYPSIYIFKGLSSMDEEVKPKRKSRQKHRDTFSFPTLTPSEKLLNGVFK
jgi:hypothetical protein